MASLLAGLPVLHGPQVVRQERGIAEGGRFAGHFFRRPAGILGGRPSYISCVLLNFESRSVLVLLGVVEGGQGVAVGNQVRAYPY